MSGPKRIIVAVAVLLVLLAAFTVYSLLTVNNSSGKDQLGGNPYSISNQQFGKLQTKKFKASAPTSNDPAVQIPYYEDLMGAQLNAQDYKGAIDSYTKLIAKVKDVDLPMNVYSYATQAYIKTGDSKAASAVLDRAQKAADNVQNDSDLKDQYTQRIAELRQEIK